MDKSVLCWISQKGVDEKIYGDVLRWFGHVDRLENDRITKRVYVRVRTGSRSLGRPRKRWNDTVKDWLRKRALEVRRARKMIHDRSVWRGFVRRNAWGVARVPLTLTICHTCELPELHEALEG